MFKRAKVKQTLLLIGDIGILYAALFTMLFIRYGRITEEVRELHIIPFSALFFFALLIFYIMGFYELKFQKNTPEFTKKFFLLIGVNLLIAIIFFYFVPWFSITPKTNLFIFMFLFGTTSYIYRILFNNFLKVGIPSRQLLFIGHNQAFEEIATHLAANPQLGYEIKFWAKEGLPDKESGHISQLINTHGIDMIVIPAHIRKQSRSAQIIYQNLKHGIDVISLTELYEIIFEKVPLTELEEEWFIEHLSHDRKIYDSLKRPCEVLFSTILLILFSPIAIIIMLAIKLTSHGSAFFTQTRIGKNGDKFVLWKFRTVHVNAEKNGAQWAEPNDSRQTGVGKFLRKTHLDELPQLFNIVSGDLSLVGPRPERPEFTGMLEKEIPFYPLRHLVRPGLTGWAQIKYRYGASLDDSYEKAQYDIYYLKNRGFLFDVSIVLKTIKLFFVSA